MSRWLILSILFRLGVASSVATQADWVYVDSKGLLQYKQDSYGNRVMDFSSAGYWGGGVSLPDAPVMKTVDPSGGDDGIAIQNAIDQVSALPLVNGLRGAVLLSPGTFHVSKTLNISASGVVVRGSGSGPDGTLILMTGTTEFLCFNVQGSGSYSVSGTVNITNAYVPSGADTFSVNNPSGFKVGDSVLVIRRATQAWVHYLGMDTLVRDGLPQTWIPIGMEITTDRLIKAVSGNTITLNAPLTDNLDSIYLGNPVATLSRYVFPGRISQVGIEHLKVQCPAGDSLVYSAVKMDNLSDGWIQDVVGQETQNAFTVDKGARRVTVDQVVNNVTVPQTRRAMTADFACAGTQVLFNKCRSNGEGDWPFTTLSVGTGPIVMLNCASTQSAGVSPHMRWTTGILVDNGDFPNTTVRTPGISFRNRGNDGTGHGWTSAWSVAWNVATPYLLVSAPPGTLNWAIGGQGAKVTQPEPEGIYDHVNTEVTPKSLYIEQLLERLGPSALKNIGYGTESVIPRRNVDSGPRVLRADFASNAITFTLPYAGEVGIQVYRSDGTLRTTDRIVGKVGINTVKLFGGVGAGESIATGPFMVRLSGEGLK